MSLYERQVSRGYRDLALSTIRGIEAGIQKERGDRRRVPGKDVLKEIEEFNERTLHELPEEDQLRFSGAYRDVLDIVRAPFVLRAKQMGSIVGAFGLEVGTFLGPFAGEKIAAHMLNLGVNEGVAPLFALALGGILAFSECFALMNPIDNIDKLFYDGLMAGMLQNPDLYKDYPLPVRVKEHQNDSVEP